MYNNGANPIPFDKIFNGQLTARFQAIIDRGGIFEDTFRKYGFYDLEIVIDNNASSDVNLTIKSLKLLTADSNSGFGYFTDIVVKGLVDSNHKIQSGSIFTNHGVFIENSGMDDEIGTFITDGDKGLKLIISDSNGYIHRKLVKSDKASYPYPYWVDTDVIDCDTNQGVAGYFDYIKLNNNELYNVLPLIYLGDYYEIPPSNPPNDFPINARSVFSYCRQNNIPYYSPVFSMLIPSGINNISEILFPFTTIQLKNSAGSNSPSFNLVIYNQNGDSIEQVIIGSNILSQEHTNYISISFVGGGLSPEVIDFINNTKGYFLMMWKVVNVSTLIVVGYRLTIESNTYVQVPPNYFRFR
jgi:hypothetical protein